MFLTPRWVLSHLFVVVLVLAFIAAGLWQVNRLNERQDENAIVEARMGAPVLLDDVLEVDLDTLEFRRVQVQGRFDPASEILIANRSNEGNPGFWMWTNFETEHGDLLVNRGFVSRAVVLQTEGAPELSEAAPTDGNVIIEGLLRTGLSAGRLSEDKTQLSRPNPALASETLGLAPAIDASIYLQLEAQEPARTSGIPSAVPAPDLGEGPHRSYAFQWFTFATIGIIGYSLLLVRIQRGDQSRGDVPI